MSVTAIENACDFGALPAGACQLSFNFANSCERTFPSSQRRGGRDINKMLRSILIYGADGVVSLAKRFPRSDHFYGFALSRSRFAPVCAGKRSLRGFLIDRAANTPLGGGECSSQRRLPIFKRSHHREFMSIRSGGVLGVT